MVSAIKGPGNLPSPQGAGVHEAGAPAAQNPLEGAQKPGVAAPLSGNAVEEARRGDIQKEWKRLRDRTAKRSLAGAAHIFSEAYFPPNLLDTQNPQNDPKYLRLLASILGFEALFEEGDEEEEGDGFAAGDPGDLDADE